MQPSTLTQPATISAKTGGLRWWAPVALAGPALLPAANHYIVSWRLGMVPTGFIQSDMPYYMANAREHFDQGFQLTYGNPFAAYHTPAIYFQPQTFLLAGLYRLGVEPGVAFNLFGLAAMLFAAWAAVRFYEETIGLESRAKKLGLICFFWGGGLLSLTGFVSALAQGSVDRASFWTSIWKLQPAGAAWMLNFGRNLSNPMEAYYHGVFLLCLLLLIRRNFAGSLALAALLSMSHPYAGLSLALILVTYSALELALRSGTVRLSVLVASAVIVVLHVGYYLIFLNRFADHRVIQNQYALPWLYEPSTYVPALSIVGFAALLRFAGPSGARRLLQDPRNRLYIVWFLVICALSQHNLVMKPMEPAHFTRGYDWMALFFLATPVLVTLLTRLLAIQRTTLRAALLCLILAVFMSDNAVWLSRYFVWDRVPQGLVLTTDQKAVLVWLAGHAAPEDMVVSEDEPVSYLVNVYTRVRSWVGQLTLTPGLEQRRMEVANAFQNGLILPEWERMRVFYISRRDNHAWKAPASVRALYHNSELAVWGPPADR
jgi:hypothetical protein